MSVHRRIPTRTYGYEIEHLKDPFMDLAVAVVEQAVRDYFRTALKGEHIDAAQFLLGDEHLLYIDADMRPILKRYEEVYMLRVYHYRGPVTRFGKIHTKIFDCYTSAESEAQAMNNIRSKYKTWAHFQQSAKVELDPRYLTEEDIR